jgi:hypothetical protein
MLMRKALSLVVALTLLASAAQAQGGDRDRDDEEDWWRGTRENRDERGRGRDHDDGWREGRYHRGGGARFFVRSGETRVGVVCDSGESMRSCVDAALTLLDRAKQAGSGGTAPPLGGSARP